MVKGITKRWLLKYLSFTIAFALLIIFGGSFVVRSYYYDHVKSRLATAGTQMTSGSVQPTDTADMAVGSYDDNLTGGMELIAAVLTDESGMPTDGQSYSQELDYLKSMSDFEQASTSADGEGCWTGTLSSGENVMAYTVIARDSNGDFLSAARLLVSLDEVDYNVLFAILILISVVMIFLASVFIPGLLFIGTIVKPVRELRATASRIAQGDFETRVDKMYDDEIGELADSINHMAEEIKASDRMKNDFISSVSHELRTPLTAIKGWAETMSIGEPDPVTMGKGLGVIINETERLTGMVEELLDFSRIQNGRMVLVMDKTDLLAELDEAVYMLRERAVSEKKHFVYDEPDILAPVLGDKNRLRQVFINIIDNALKYTPEGGVIGIQVVEENELIKVVISDTGCGINEKDLPRIKDKFYKANQTVRGSGIGLAVADEIMTLHKGSLEINSTENVGTTVTISIPMLDSDDEEILKS